MLNQLIVTSVAAGTRRPRSARRLALAKPPQFHIKNTIKLRGFLGADADVPTTDHIRFDSYSILTLCVETGVWKAATNEWSPRTTRVMIICPGPFFCGFTRNLKQGCYVEVEGELRPFTYAAPIKISRDPAVFKLTGIEVHATRIERLDYPPIGVEIDEDD